MDADHREGEVFACVNCVFFLSTMSVEEAVRLHLGHLAKAVAGIEAGLAASARP